MPYSPYRRGARAALVILAAVSPAGLAQAGNILSQRGTAPAPVTASMTANLLAQQQAAAVAMQSQNELAKISSALLAVQAAQTAARNAAAAAPSTVQNGLQTGGLVPDSGLAAPGVANPVQDWTPRPPPAAGPPSPSTRPRRRRS